MSALSLSVVSHEQTDLLNHFIADVFTSVAGSQIFWLVVTCNLPEAGIMAQKSLDFLHGLDQPPRGFAVNHNQAFEACERSLFCALNPDIRLEENPFPALLDAMERDPSIAPIAPEVFDRRSRRSGVVDEGFHLCYEDVRLSACAWKDGWPPKGDRDPVRAALEPTQSSPHVLTCG